MAEWCEANKWPINFHVSEGLNVKYPNFTPTPLDIYLDIAKSSKSKDYFIPLGRDSIFELNL